MRFPFPAADPVSADPGANAELPSPELDIRADGKFGQADVPVAEFGDATAARFEPEIRLAVIEGVDSLTLTAESDPIADSPELTADSVPAEHTPQLAAESAPEVSIAVSPPHLPDAEPMPSPVVQPRPRTRRKVIAFPRQPGGAETAYRLADPILPEQPRILDVPEELEAFPTTPFLDGLRFEPAAASAVPDDYELPFRAASIPLRLYAAVVDWSLVALAAAAFAFIGHKMLPDLQFTKPVRLTAALVIVLLWAIYQYLFVVYAGRTAGMAVVGIRLSIFKGRKLCVRHRRNRILGLYLSAASLAMGLLWAFVDVDTLCWHDRISGTYLTKRA